jgi:hypothetical protein
LDTTVTCSWGELLTYVFSFGVALFVIKWGAKHLLDWLLLPILKRAGSAAAKSLDRIAITTEPLARRRVRNLLHRYLLDISFNRSLRYQMAVMQGRNLFLITLVVMFTSLLVLSVLTGVAQVQKTGAVEPGVSLMAQGGLLLLALVYCGNAIQGPLYERRLRRDGRESHVQDLRRRLIPLAKKAGMKRADCVRMLEEQNARLPVPVLLKDSANPVTELG